MRFKVLAIIEGLQGVAQAVTTLFLDFLGFGYWALVLGNVSFSIASTLFTLVWKRQRFAWPHFSMIRNALIYSRHIVVAQLSWWIYDNGDFIVAGRVLGAAPLGNYGLAWTLAHAPLEKLTNLVNRVAPSIFAAAQTDNLALRRYLRNTSGALSLAIFPAVLGMALVANDFVRIALGQKWIGVVLPLELLSLYVLFRSNVILLFPLLNVISEERFSIWNSILMVAVLLPSFYLGSHWGTGGIGASGFLFIRLLPWVFWRLFPEIKMPVGEYLGALWPAVSGCILMTIAVELFKRTRNPGWPLYLDLALEILIGATVYALALILMHRNRLRAYIGLVKNLRG